LLSLNRHVAKNAKKRGQIAKERVPRDRTPPPLDSRRGNPNKNWVRIFDF
jgi:hypothetical protein